MTQDSILLGDYELTKVVAKGGMAEVWRAVHSTLDTPVAIKLIKDQAVAREVFEREVQTIASLNHPGVIRIFDYGLVDEATSAKTRGKFPEHCPWFAMELAELGTIHDTPPKDYEKLYHVVASVLEALAHAHARGFVHRDIKPENLLITDLDTRHRPIVKISDFGIARSQFEDRTRQGTESAGTPRYMAPEQFMGKTHLIGPSSDFYALGCVVLEWLNDRPLFGGVSNPLQLGFKHVNDPLPELRPTFDIPIGLANWLERMTNKVPAQRFSFAAEALAAMPAPTTASNTRESRLVWDSADADGARPATSKNLFHLQEIPFFGREDAREKLRDKLFTVRRQDTASSIVISGSPGVGKSRLAEWFAQRAHELGASHYLRVTHSDLDRRDALARAMATYFRCIGKSREIARARLFERLGGAGSVDLETLVDLMQPFLDLRDDDVTRSAVPARLRDLTLASVIEVLSADRPLILWLDDAQWGADSLRFADLLMNAVEVSTMPVLVMATIQDDALTEESANELDELLARPVTTQIPLGPLPDEEQARLIRHLVDVDDQAVSDVVASTGGIPLRAIHTIGDWLESGMVEPRAEGFVASSDNVGTQEFARPSELWKARFDECLRELQAADEARRALEVAAAIGRVVQQEEWSLALGSAGIPEQTGLVERLVGRRLAKWTDEGWQFLHGDLTDTIRETALANNRWQSAHRACARALLSLGDEHTHEMWARIAGHQREAGLPNAAFSNLVKAARIALHAEHQKAAIAYRRSLLELADEMQVGPRDMRKSWLAYFAIAAGSNRRPLAETEEMSRLLIDTARQCRWYEVLARTHEVLMITLAGQGKHDEAIIAGQESIDLFEQLGESRSAAQVRGAMAQMLLEAGLIEEATHLALASLEEAEQEDDDETVARALERLGRAQIGLENLEEASDYFTRGLELARQIGMRELEAHIIDGMATIARHQERFDDAIEGYRQAAQLFDSMQSRSVWVSQYNRGAVLALRDDWEHAIDLLRDALAAFEDFGLHSYALLARAAVGTNASLNGDHALAREHWAGVEAGFKTSPFYHPDLVWYCGVTNSTSDNEDTKTRCTKISRRTKRYRTV